VETNGSALPVAEPDGLAPLAVETAGSALRAEETGG